MTIYSFWVFDRHCHCIFNREYAQIDTTSTNRGTSISGTINSKDNEDTAKLLFGALFSLRNIARNLGDKVPAESDSSIKPFNNQLNSFTTGKYRAHFYESLSNLRFCILSDLKTRDLKRTLKELNEIYVDSIVRNPLAQIVFDEGEVIDDMIFVKRVDNVLENLEV